MNTVIQNILAIAALIMAVGFLVTKFFLKKKRTKKAIGDHHDCDNCH